ncbi:MAG: universal stress protein [Actinomycetota bacterium]|nr:universal stress protein [Actinomycetota bacterium]
MMLDNSGTTSVVVAVDGSASAVDAALWAVDEALDRDIPLRLVYVIEPPTAETADSQDLARHLATAEVAVRYVATAVESSEAPVKIEVEILQGPTVPTLLEASRSAAMLCVGARGIKHATHGRIGSTAAALAAAARCPVAIVRAHRPHDLRDRAVVIEIDDNAAGSSVLHRGLAAARRRHAPVRVLTPTRMGGDLQAAWDRRLAEWRRSYPDLDITTVSMRGDILDYLADHAETIQLVVTGRERPGGIAQLVNAPGNTALRDTDCSILVCEPHNAL